MPMRRGGGDASGFGGPASTAGGMSRPGAGPGGRVGPLSSSSSSTVSAGGPPRRPGALDRSMLGRGSGTGGGGGGGGGGGPGSSGPSATATTPGSGSGTPAAASTTPRMDPGVVARKARVLNDEINSGVHQRSEAVEEIRTACEKEGAPPALFTEHLLRDAALGKGRKYAKSLDLVYAAVQEGAISTAEVEAALLGLVSTLVDDMEEDRRCVEYLGAAVGLLSGVHGLGEGVASRVLTAALTAGEEPLDDEGDYGLVDLGYAESLVVEVLRAVADEQDEGTAKACWRGVGKEFGAFVAGFERTDAGKKAAEAGIQELLA